MILCEIFFSLLKAKKVISLSLLRLKIPVISDVLKGEQMRMEFDAGN